MSQATVNEVRYLTADFYSWLRRVPALIWPLLLLCTLWCIPTPEGLSVQAWHLFAIFFTTIMTIILNPLPMGAVCFIALALCGITQTLKVTEILSAFSSNIIWLILLAFLLARGFIKTGLGARLAYYFMRSMGKSSIGLAYGLITTEFILAPFTPSNTARGGGIVYPIVQALSEKYESSPKTGSSRKIGAYLMKLGYQAPCFLPLWRPIP
jgi:divalent anion:Na+ symporter, DASS family